MGCRERLRGFAVHGPALVECLGDWMGGGWVREQERGFSWPWFRMGEGLEFLHGQRQMGRRWRLGVRE